MRIPIYIESDLRKETKSEILSYEQVSSKLHLIQTADGLFKYTDSLYKQVKPRGEHWEHCQTKEVHTGLF